MIKIDVQIWNDFDKPPSSPSPPAKLGTVPEGRSASGIPVPTDQQWIRVVIVTYCNPNSGRLPTPQIQVDKKETLIQFYPIFLLSPVAAVIYLQILLHCHRC